MSFILSKLEIDIHEIEDSLEDFISRGTEGTKKPMLIFVCGAERHCFTSIERSKVAAIFVTTLSISQIFLSPSFIIVLLYFCLSYLELMSLEILICSRSVAGKYDRCKNMLLRSREKMRECDF